MHDHNNPCAIALFEGTELILVWCNTEYRQLVGEPLDGTDQTGLPLHQYAPHIEASRGQLYRAVLEDGVPRCGTDHMFSVEDGTLVARWVAYRPLDDHLLTVIDVSGAQRTQ